jgi:hypothetical protein
VHDYEDAHDYEQVHEHDHADEGAPWLEGVAGAAREWYATRDVSP